jgi:hypothetical protein
MDRPGPWHLTGLAIALLLGATAPALAQSCAMCGSAFGADDPIGRAFSWSILVLMAAPYTICGAVGGWLFYTYRRGRGRSRAAVIDLPRAGRPAPASPAGNEGEPS